MRPGYIVIRDTNAADVRAMPKDEGKVHGQVLKSVFGPDVSIRGMQIVGEGFAIVDYRFVFGWHDCTTFTVGKLLKLYVNNELHTTQQDC